MIAIIGGGIIGLSIGWELAQSGAQVTLFERDQCAQGATWAAAGMLTPWAAPDAEDLSLLKLELASHALWPAFVQRLESDSSVTSVGYRTEGRLFVSLDHEDFVGLQKSYAFNIGQGIDAQLLTGAEARYMEPNLPQTVTNAVFTPTGHQVDNRLVGQALKEAFIRAGGMLREQTPVQGIITESGRVTAVKLLGQTAPADTVVLAAGAWSSEVTGLPTQAMPQVRPVKGQMLAVQMPPDSPLLSRMVTGNTYLIPRLDGRLLIGATVEEAGFDTDVTAGGLFNLLIRARRMLPAIDKLPIVESWAGLRPATPDNRPVIGRTPVDGLLVATGHYRLGILLAPITAQAISRQILEDGVIDVVNPFRPQ